MFWDRFIAGLTDWLIRNRAWLFGAAVVLSLLAIWPASQLKFDQSIESLYAREDPRLQDYVDGKGVFGGDEFVFVAYQDPQLLEPETGTKSPHTKISAASRERMTSLAKELSKVPGIVPDSVQTLATVTDIPAKVNLLGEKFELLGQKIELQGELKIPDDQRHHIWDMARGLFLGDDNQTTAVMLRLDPQSANTVGRGRAIADIRAAAEKFTQNTGLETYIAGEPVQVHDMFRYVQQDGSVLGWSSSILLMVIILIFFRSLRWVVLPMLVVHATLVWTKAILVMSGLQLSMVSSMLTSLVTIIGIAEVMHVTVRYQEHRDRLSRVESLRQALRELCPCTFWTVTTTAAGFAAELVSSVKPVQSFGIMMTIGSMLILVTGAMLVPGGVLLGNRWADPKPLLAGAWLDRVLDRMTDWVEHHPRPTSIACVLLTVVALAGMFRLRVETDFTKNFRANSPIVKSLGFIETKLGGAGTWEVNFPAPDKLDAAYLEKVRKLAERLRNLQEPDGTRPLTKVIAVTDGVDLISRFTLVADLKFFKKDIPLRSLSLNQQLEAIGTTQPQFLSGLYMAQAGRMRIMLRAHERQPSKTKLKLIADVENAAREAFPEAKATGLFVLLTYLIQSLLGDQWLNFGLGAFMIVSLMWIAFRSLRIGLISLVPNLLPIALVIGAMGWIDLPINIATAMIASVTMGLTIDSSIHYLAGLQRSQASGMSFFESLRTTQGGVGRSLVLANFALMAGFLVLTLSHFIPLVYFGILVSVAMLGGLLGNLIILPLMLRIGHKSDGPRMAGPPAVLDK